MDSQLFKTILLLIHCIFLCASHLFAQFEGVDNPDYIQNVKAKGKLFDLDNLMRQRDTFKVFEITSALRKYALKNDDKIQLFNADFAEVAYLIPNTEGPQNERIISTLQRLIIREHKNGSLAQEITARRYLAKFYWDKLKNYELAFEEYLQLDKILSTSTSVPITEKSATFCEIGKAYWYFKDYELALKYFNKIPAQTVVNISSEETYYRLSLNYKALAWQELGQLDSAGACLHELADYALGINDTSWYGISSGYLGYNYFLKKDHEQAISYLNKGIEIAMSEKDSGWAIQQKLWLANVYFHQNKASDAMPLVQWCRQFMAANRSQSPQKLYKLLYPLLSKMYTFMGNFPLANKYIDSALLVTNELNQEYSSLVVARIQQKQFLSIADKIELDKNAKIRERNMLLGFVFVLLFLSVYIFLLNRRKHMQQQQLKQSMILEQQMELSLASEQLEAFTKMIADKNRMIETIQHQLGKSSTDEVIGALQKSNILSNEDWETFKTLFEKVHGGYLQNLREKYHGLSLSETRYMALAKLNFSNKEMAYTLGISADSVRVTWHRLRKKLNLPNETTLAELVASI